MSIQMWNNNENNSQYNYLSYERIQFFKEREFEQVVLGKNERKRKLGNFSTFNANVN